MIVAIVAPLLVQDVNLAIRTPHDEPLAIVQWHLTLRKRNFYGWYAMRVADGGGIAIAIRRRRLQHNVGIDHFNLVSGKFRGGKLAMALEVKWTSRTINRLVAHAVVVD